MDIRIHPLALLNISDHFTRSAAQFNQKRVFGAIFGVQQARDVHVYDAFDIGFEGDEKDPNNLKLRLDGFEADMSNYKKVFVNYEFLGWYSSGTSLSPIDTEIHQLMMKYNERPLYLVLNPSAKAGDKELPFTLYEEEIHMVADKGTPQFVPVSFRVQADEAERISAVHCAQVVVSQQSGSQVTPAAQSLHKGVKSLKERVQVLYHYLQEVSQGKVAPDQAILRQIKGVCNRLPVMHSDQFEDDLLTEYNDNLLVTLLSTLTRDADAINEAMEKFDLAFSDRTGGPLGRRGGGGGAGFRMPHLRTDM